MLHFESCSGRNRKRSNLFGTCATGAAFYDDEHRQIPRRHLRKGMIPTQSHSRRAHTLCDSDKRAAKLENTLEYSPIELERHLFELVEITDERIRSTYCPCTTAKVSSICDNRLIGFHDRISRIRFAASRIYASPNRHVDTIL